MAWGRKKKAMITFQVIKRGKFCNGFQLQKVIVKMSISVLEIENEFS